MEGPLLMFGVAPNPSPDGSNWTVLVASPEAEDDRTTVEDVPDDEEIPRGFQ